LTRSEMKGQFTIFRGRGRSGLNMEGSKWAVGADTTKCWSCGAL